MAWFVLVLVVVVVAGTQDGRDEGSCYTGGADEIQPKSNQGSITVGRRVAWNKVLMAMIPFDCPTAFCPAFPFAAGAGGSDVSWVIEDERAMVVDRVLITRDRSETTVEKEMFRCARRLWEAVG